MLGCSPLFPALALDRLAAAVWSSQVSPAAARAVVLSGTVPDQPAAPDPGAVQRTDSDELRVEALVTLAKRGDAEAFGQLYERYVDTIFRYVYVRVGSRAVAEDLTSETFLRALRRLDTFTWQGRDIGAWFVTIARNLVLDDRKSSRFRLEVATDELVGLDNGRRGSPTGGAAPCPPEEAALRNARDTRLVEAIRTLNPDQQECLTLRFFHELSLAETALAMGRSQGAIKQLQLRAVRALAAALGEERP